MEIGQIVSVHGIAGELKVYPWADSPSSLTGVKTVYLGAVGGDGVRVVSARPHGNMLLMRLEGVTSPEQGRKLVGKTLLAHRDEIPQEEGDYFIADLIGLEVIDASDRSHIGVLQDVTNTGHQDLYHVRMDDGRVRLVPGVSAFIKETDPEAGFIAIQPIKGLLDDDD